MPTPKSDKDDPIDDGMFDFLGEDAANRPARRKDAQSSPAVESAQRSDGLYDQSAGPTVDQAFDEQHPRVRAPKPLPIIRKPVPVSESGPNKSPNERGAAGADTRQKIANSGDFEDDFGFLNDGQRSVPIAQPERGVGSAHSIDRDFDENWNEGLHEFSYEDNERTPPRRKLLWLALAGVVVLGVASFGAERAGLFNLADNSDDNAIANRNNAASTSDAITVPQAGSVTTTPTRSSVAELFRSELQRIETLVSASEFDAATQALDSLDPRVLGYGNPEFSALRDQIARGDAGPSEAQLAEQAREEEEARLLAEAQVAEDARQAEAARLAAAEQQAEAARLAAEARQAAEARSEAEARRATEARQAEEARLAAEARQAEEARLAAEARQAEEARLAAEARQAEEARLAAEARQAEEARLAAEARQAEEARQAAQEQIALEARQAEEARLAAEARRIEELQRAAEVRRLEQARAAAEARRAEQAREAAEARRAEQARAAAEARRAEQARAAADARRAEEARIAAAANSNPSSAQDQADRLEEQRREAIAAEQRARARAAAAARAAQASGERPTTPAPQAPLVTPSVSDQEASDRLASAAVQNSQRNNVPQNSRQENNRQPDNSGLSVSSYPITDADFNLVYRRFIDVKNAMERQDINAITQLAVTNGTRVQGLLQLFSNSDSLDVRIDNVSTRNSSGMIVGTLTIDKVVRRGGVVTTPPADLRSFTLTTRRDAAGWSKIRW